MVCAWRALPLCGWGCREGCRLGVLKCGGEGGGEGEGGGGDGGAVGEGDEVDGVPCHRHACSTFLDVSHVRHCIHVWTQSIKPRYMCFPQKVLSLPVLSARVRLLFNCTIFGPTPSLYVITLRTFSYLRSSIVSKSIQESLRESNSIQEYPRKSRGSKSIQEESKSI